MGYDVRNNEAEKRFEIALDGKTAFAQYRLSGNHITFMHTEVPKEFGGKGIGSALAKGVLEHAKANNLWVTPMCPFIKAFIDKHAEYQDLLKQS